MHRGQPPVQKMARTSPEKPANNNRTTFETPRRVPDLGTKNEEGKTIVTYPISQPPRPEQNKIRALIDTGAEANLIKKKDLFLRGF